MFGRNAEVEARIDAAGERIAALERVQQNRRDHEWQQSLNAMAAGVPVVVDDPQEAHQTAILADFQTAVRTNDEAARCLRHAEAVAAQAALALVESRKQMKRVAEGSI